jgi:hypothetical protein
LSFLGDTVPETKRRKAKGKLNKEVRILVT